MPRRGGKVFAPIPDSRLSVFRASKTAAHRFPLYNKSELFSSASEEGFPPASPRSTLPPYGLDPGLLPTTRLTSHTQAGARSPTLEFLRSGRHYWSFFGSNFNQIQSPVDAICRNRCPSPLDPTLVFLSLLLFKLLFSPRIGGLPFGD